ncbi:MAG: hypothetical protein ACT4QC_09685 [Planctomycetaceae bacterium]
MRPQLPSLRYCRLCGHVTDPTFKSCPHCQRRRTRRRRSLIDRAPGVAGTILLVACIGALVVLHLQSQGAGPKTHADGDSESEIARRPADETLPINHDALNDSILLDRKSRFVAPPDGSALGDGAIYTPVDFSRPRDFGSSRERH